MSAIQNIANEASSAVVLSATGAGVGYLFARAFMSINPINAAVFCATNALVSKVINPIFNPIFNGPTANGASKFVGSVLQLAATIASSVAISNALGYPISFGAAATASLVPAAVVLTVFTVGVSLFAIAYLAVMFNSAKSV